MSDTTATPTPHLDPEDQAFIDEAIKEKIPPFQDLSIQQFRDLFDKLQTHKPIQGVTETEIEVPFGPKDRDVIKTFLFRPKHVKRAFPVILYLHGGGWVGGNVFDYDSICRDLALQTGCAVVFPEYSLAPEKKFPTQNEECFAVLKYIAKFGKSRGLRTDKFVTVSDSAGGQLATAVATLAHERRHEININIVFQVLFNPVTDTSSSRETLSEFEFFDGPLLTVPFINEFINLYIPDAKDRLSILASPLLMSKAQAARQPPTLVVVGSADPLRSEGIAFAELLQSSGVSCAVVRGEGQVHDTVVFEATRNGPTASALLLMAAGLLTDALKKGDDEDCEGKMKSQTDKEAVLN